MKVIYISYIPLSPKILKDFFINDLRQNGIETAYWDLSKLYFPKQFKKKDILNDWEKQFRTFSQLKKTIKIQNKTGNIFYIPIITYTGKVLRLFRLLTKNQCKILFFARGMLPSPSLSATDRFKTLLSSKELLDKGYLFILNRIAHFYKKMGWVKPYDAFFYAGSEGYHTIGIGANIDKKHSIQIPVNSFDYDKYLTKKGTPPFIDQPYIVFLDEYLPYHPDFLMFNMKTIDAKEYYDQINNFFDKLESQMKLKVVIAAHPKADLYQTENPFNGRQVFFNKTCELVKDSKFIVAHMSTAISFSVLYKKPILLLSTTGIRETIYSHHLFIENFAKQLNTTMILWDNINDAADKIPEVDNQAYDQYIYKYLTSQVCEKQQSKDIFINFFKNF